MYFDIANISDDVNFEGDEQEQFMPVECLKTCDEYPFICKELRSIKVVWDLNVYGAWDNEKRGIYWMQSIQDISICHHRESSV